MTANARSTILTLLARPLVLALVLFGFNAWICRELFTIEHLGRMSSIESAHIVVVRWIMEHAGELGWFPLWYGGAPFHQIYSPLSHAMAAATGWMLGLSASLAYHATAAAFYSIGPLTLFWFAYVLSGRRWLSFFAGAAYSVLSPAAFFMPLVAQDIGFTYGGRRLQALAVYGEGPHIVSLTLIPLALLAIHYALGKRTLFSIWIAAIAVAAIAMTNWIGALAFAVAVAFFLLTVLDRDWLKTLGIVATIGALGYAMAAPWIPPSNIRTVRDNAQMLMGHFPVGPKQLLYLGILTVIAVALLFLLRRFRASHLLRFSLPYLVWMGGVTISRDWFGFHALPQPERYHLEMEMAFVLAVACLLASLVQRLRTLPRGALLAGVVIALCVAGLWQQGWRTRRYIRGLLQTNEIGETLEYEVANWLNRNLPDGRVFAGGSTQFWLNVFSDVRQVGGSSEQGVVNPVYVHLMFGTRISRDSGVVNTLWLRAFGVDAIVVSGPNSRDHYRDYHDPKKFEGLLPVLWRAGDDTIYEVPRRSRSLARVIPVGTTLENRPEFYDYDGALAGFVEVLQDDSVPIPITTWDDPQNATIRVQLEPDQQIYVQMSYHPGWRATVGGESRLVRPDGLGQVVIEPECAGDCTVQLTWSGGAEMTVARAARALALVLPPVFVLYRRWR